jgi:hypothetical protein
VGSSTTSPTKRASYPFRQPQQRVEPVCKGACGAGCPRRRHLGNPASDGLHARR